MEFNGIFFPAPKCSYTAKSQNLIWIPSHPIHTPAYHYQATQSYNTRQTGNNTERINSISKSPLLKCFCQEEPEEEKKQQESEPLQRNSQISQGAPITQAQALLHENNSTPPPPRSVPLTPPKRIIHKIQSQTICKCDRDKKCELHTSKKKKQVTMIKKSVQPSQEVSEEETKTNFVQQQHDHPSQNTDQACKKTQEIKPKHNVSSSPCLQLQQNNHIDHQCQTHKISPPGDTKNEDAINTQLYLEKRQRFSSYFDPGNIKEEKYLPRLQSSLQKGSLLSRFFTKEIQEQRKDQSPSEKDSRDPHANNNPRQHQCHLHQHPISTPNSRGSPSTTDNMNSQQTSIESTTSLQRAAQLGPRLNHICQSFIPCLYLPFKPGSDKILVYFHGNAEDLGYSYEFASSLRKFLALNVLVIEYPGYGLYRGHPNSDQILADADSVYEFIRKKLNVPPKDIILFGRSIGSGPACYLAGTRNIGGLILMCPYTSIRNVVKNLTGSFISLLVAERFRNIDCIKGVKAPTLFIHGKKDQLIPYFNSLQLMECIQQISYIHLSPEMTHNDFDFIKDMIEPTKDFFCRANIVIQSGSKIRVPEIYSTYSHVC